MSIPFLKVTCDRCSFSGSSLVTFGRFLWSDNEKVFPVDRKLGICEDCDQIVAMEYIPDPQVVKKAKAIRQKYEGPPLWRHLEKNEAKYLASQTDFDLLERIVALERPPVCLKCAGSSVHLLKIPAGTDRDVPVDIGISHAGCSGQLRVQSSGGLRVGMRSMTRKYDIFGKLLDEQYDKEFLQQRFPPSDRTFINRGNFEDLGVGVVKKPISAKKNKKMRSFLDQNREESD